MKKFTGNYSSDAGKALKNADRIFCRIGDNGNIYLCNNYLIYRMTPIEYAVTVQPVTKCEAGNWNIENGEKREAGPADFDVIKAFRNIIMNASTGAVLNRCPADFAVEKGGALSSYYSTDGFAAFYNRLYTIGLRQGLTPCASNALSPAVFYDGEEAVAAVMPVEVKPELARAVKAYFTADQADEDKPAELDNLRAQLEAERNARLAVEEERDALRRGLDDVRGEEKFNETERAAMREQITEQDDEISSLRNELDNLRAELDKLHAEQSAAPMEQVDELPTVDVKSAAEIIAARFTGLDGVRVVIKGAQTAAPVVWLAGDTEKHADAIRAAGAKWSAKKGAYYVRVA